VVEALEYGLRAPGADPKQLRANTPTLPGDEPRDEMRDE
jgi:hypothetical protein